jgi:light-regulated signal transduction histidine kinase (bacteriophytochrome)
MARSSRLFGAFHRAYPPGAFPGPGTGLAIAEKIARRHAAWVRVPGRQGEGTPIASTLEPPAGASAGDDHASGA